MASFSSGVSRFLAPLTCAALVWSACSSKSDVQEGDGKGGKNGSGGAALGGDGNGGNGTGSILNLGGSDGNDGSGANNGGPSCRTDERSAELSPIYLVFAFDVSGSMGHLDCPYWNHDPAVKWTPVIEAVAAFFEDETSTNINASMTLFPAQSSSCNAETYETPDVPMQPLPSTAFAERLRAYEEDEVQLNVTDPVPITGSGAWRGGTPTLAVVNGTLTQLEGLISEHPDAKFALVLVTDGVPQSCSGNTIDNVAAAVAEAHSELGIPTYVIGVKDPATPPAVAPWEEGGERVWACTNGAGWRAGYNDVDTPRPSDPNALDNLGQIAEAGGTESAFLIDTGNPSATRTSLRSAIDQIRAQAISCELERPEPPVGQTFDPNKVNVRYDSGDDETPLYYDADCEAEDSWRYKNGDTNVLELCPSTCAKIQADPYAAVQVEFGCVQRTVVR